MDFCLANILQAAMIMNGNRCSCFSSPVLPANRHLKSPGQTKADLKNLIINIADHSEGL